MSTRKAVAASLSNGKKTGEAEGRGSFLEKGIVGPRRECWFLD